MLTGVDRPSDDALLVLTPLRLEALAARRGASSARVLHTGMGARRARRAAGRLAAAPAPAALVTGFCGALAPGLAPGDVVLASELRGPEGTTACADTAVLARMLRDDGLTVHVGPLLSTSRVVRGERRAALARTGALAVDMESAWLAAGCGASLVVTLRVVLDTPSRELHHPVRTGAGFLRAMSSLRRSCATAERWSAALADREVVLAAPRASCAGVVRAVDTVRNALAAHGAPLYVRKQIVHNARVVAELEELGAVFVEELDEVPPGSTVVFSAHGVSPAVRRQAHELGLNVIDATCPLVAKVHAEARRFASSGYDIVLIGHEDHEEVEGTFGEAPDSIQVAATAADIATLQIADPERVGYLTQTTLAVDETAGIVEALRERFPALVGPASDDICYATQNRQDAVRALAEDCDLILVVGSQNSSNSRRLVEVAVRAGRPAVLVDGPDEIPVGLLTGARRVGVTAGASAPEALVQEVVAALRGLGTVSVSERRTTTEDVHFKLPVQHKPPG